MPKTAAKRIEKSPEAYRSIGEASDELGLQPHVLRYWETKFTTLVKPLKRRDGRRMFRPEDMQALRAIQMLVHDKGMTLKGAKKLLSEQGIESVLNGNVRIMAVAEAISASRTDISSPVREMQTSVRQAFEVDPKSQAVGRDLEAVLSGLTDLKQRLDKARLRRAA